jgi:NCS1 family nucleobase:cation symporter-1
MGRAAALNYMMQINFRRFDNLTLMIIGFAVLQVRNAMFGLKAMAKFDGLLSRYWLFFLRL